MIVSYYLLMSPSHPISVRSRGSSSYTVTIGTGFTLTCNVGAGYSTSVVWSKDGSTSLPSSAMASGNVLIFTNPQPADTGKYTCSFMGSNGPVSEAFVVSIEGELVEVWVCFMSECVGVSDSVPADDQCKCIYMMLSSPLPLLLLFLPPPPLSSLQMILL